MARTMGLFWDNNFYYCKQFVAVFAASSVMFGSNIDVIWFSLGKHMLLKQELALEACLVIIGAVIGAILSDAFGRREALLMTTILVLPRVAKFYLITGGLSWINRALISFGSGVTCVLVPLYICEIVAPKYRGNLMIMQLIIYTFGRRTSEFMNASCEILGEPESIFMSISFLVLSVLFHAILVCKFPETPEYLNWKNRHVEMIKSLTTLRGINSMQFPQDQKVVSTNTDVYEKEERVWCKRVKELLRPDNRSNLGIIFTLIAIRQATAQELNAYSMFVMMVNYYTTISWQMLLLCYSIVASGFCIILMLAVGILGRKLSLLFIIFTSFVATIIGTTTLTEDDGVLLGVFVARHVGHLILIGVTLAYVGEFFPVNIRAIAIAIVISCEVLMRNGFFFIGKLINGEEDFRQWDVPPPQTYSNYGAFIAAFILVLICFPKTNNIPCSSIVIETPPDGQHLSPKEATVA